MGTNTQIIIGRDVVDIQRGGKTIIFRSSDADDEFLTLEDSGPLLWQLVRTSSTTEQFFAAARSAFKQQLNGDDEQSIAEFLSELERFGIIRLV